MGLVDPGPLLEERYQRELAELKGRLGRPAGFSQRRRFNHERRKLRRHIFGRLRGSRTGEAGRFLIEAHASTKAGERGVTVAGRHDRPGGHLRVRPSP